MIMWFSSSCSDSSFAKFIVIVPYHFDSAPLSSSCCFAFFCFKWCLLKLCNYMLFWNSIFIPCLFSINATPITLRSVLINMISFSSCIVESGQKIQEEWPLLWTRWNLEKLFLFAGRRLLEWCFPYFCILKFWSCQGLSFCKQLTAQLRLNHLNFVSFELWLF